MRCALFACTLALLAAPALANPQAGDTEIVLTTQPAIGVQPLAAAPGTDITEHTRLLKQDAADNARKTRWLGDEWPSLPQVTDSKPRKKDEPSAFDSPGHFISAVIYGAARDNERKARELSQTGAPLRTREHR